mmetsp:Transcript_17408/g.29240  ORF Transcript_17408/g.29240 Transcript_17408/m.29240 type:complete len:374 (+) Transcript_17408:70-1191(+)
MRCTTANCKVFVRPAHLVATRSSQKCLTANRPAPRTRTVICSTDAQDGQTSEVLVMNTLPNIPRRNALTAALTAGTALGVGLLGSGIAPTMAEPNIAILPSTTPELASGPVSTILHMVIRSSDVKAAAAFYQAVGMKVIRERPGNIFVGYGPEVPGERMVIELAQAKEGATIGTALDHLLISVDNPDKVRKAALAAGGLEAKASGGRANAIVGPDGVKLVIIDGGNGISDPLCRLVLNVDALEPSRLFLQGLGMRLFETRSDSFHKSVVMGYGRGPRSGATLEIVSPPRGGAPKVEIGGIYDRLAISSTDIDASVNKVKKAIALAVFAKVPSGQVLKEPFVIESLGTKIAEVADPTGLVFALVDTEDFIRELA